MYKDWKLIYTESDRAFLSKDSMKKVVVPLKAQCADDAVEEGKKLWTARLKEGDDAEGAKKINGIYFWPSNPKVVLEISIEFL
jgi:hypothetical protein